MGLRVQAILIALLAISAIAQDFDPNFTYDDFMRNYNRTYVGTEKDAHERAFNTNYAILLQLKNEGKDVKINERLDWIQGQNEEFFNYKPQNSGIPASARPLRSSALFVSPSSFDWRTYGVVTPIKNQGSCGSCWSFSSTAEYQSKLAILTNGTIYDLAEQYALKCETNYSLGCNGGYPYRALQLMQNTGIPQEADYPYSPSTNYSGICTNSVGRVKLNQTVNNVIFYYFQNLTVEQLQQDLVTYGPINVGVYASDYSFNYAGSSGLISCGYSSTIDHAILLVGYNSTHWFVKNSWGTSWGHNGYGYISKATGNDCNIRQYVNEMQVNFAAPNPDPNIVNLTITLTDTYGDGWNGNVISLKQNNNVVGSFGAGFTSGNSSGPIYISIQGKIETQVVVTQLGNKTNEVGFIVKASNGTILYQRSSGTTFTANAILSAFCTLGGCPATLLLTVTMTDSGADGWNSNVLAFKQNNSIIGTFGGAFTSGSSSGPLYISVISNLLTQITVSTLGTKTNQIGFIVKAPNGTTIYQRNSSTTFTSSNIFAQFCPAGGCPNVLNLVITMTDSFGDGWNGNVLAIKQNGNIVGTFGNSFASGSSSGPIYMTVQGNLEVQIVVSSYWSWTQEMGFVVAASNGTIIYQRPTGVSFPSGIIFSTFCPTGGCPTSAYIPLAVNITDSFGDGWNGNILALKQNGSIIGYFGNSFTSGTASGPISIIAQGNIATQIIVSTFGSKSNEIGFVLKAPNGTVIHQRNSGLAFDSSTVFLVFCPAAGCSNIISLVVTMTDSFGDGWNSNILLVKQNNSLMGTFGQSFTTGSSSGPLYITVFGDISAQITVSQLGTKTNEIGFLVKAPNGTTIHQRSSGSIFNSSTVFVTFCPIGGCPDTSRLNLTITMTDSFGDGWEGTVLGIKQNDTIVGTFGNGFTSGGSSGPVYIVVQGNLETQVVVTTLGSWTNQVGFIIKAPNGTIIHQRSNGSSFSSTTIFTTFCPVGSCLTNPNVTYYLTTTDSYGDGWEGTILAFKVNTTVLYTFTLASGYSNSSIAYSFPKMQTVSVSVYFLGNYTNEVGITLVGAGGSVIFQRLAGTKFFVNTLLGSFCVQCINSSPVQVLPETAVKTKIQISSNTEQTTQSPSSTAISQSKSYMYATYALIAVSSLLALTIIFLIYRLVQLQKQIVMQKLACQPSKSKSDSIMREDTVDQHEKVENVNNHEHVETIEPTDNLEYADGVRNLEGNQEYLRSSPDKIM